jgi:hypothetical protein
MKQFILLILLVALVLLSLNAFSGSESFISIAPGPVAPTNNWLPFSTDWTQPYRAICANYHHEDGILPTRDGECPDSSFTYVSNVNANRPFADVKNAYPGCMQLKETPYCYMLPDGAYEADLARLSRVSH